jgi:hypothetical protein
VRYFEREEIYDVSTWTGGTILSVYLRLGE